MFGEPTSSFDSRMVGEVLEVSKQLTQEGDGGSCDEGVCRPDGGS